MIYDRALCHKCIIVQCSRRICVAVISENKTLLGNEYGHWPVGMLI